MYLSVTFALPRSGILVFNMPLLFSLDAPCLDPPSYNTPLGNASTSFILFKCAQNSPVYEVSTSAASLPTAL